MTSPQLEVSQMKQTNIQSSRRCDITADSSSVAQEFSMVVESLRVFAADAELVTQLAIRGSGGGVPLHDAEEECRRSVDVTVQVVNENGWRHVNEIRRPISE